MSKQIIRVSDATFRAIAAQHGFVVTEPKAEKQYTSPFAVGDTVKIIGPECSGLVGELKVINEHNTDEGDFYGVRFDGVAGYIFFRADEMKRVERWCDRCHKKTDEWREQSGEVLCERCIRELERNARSK